MSNDQTVDETEFVLGLSNLLRGSIDELIETCYFIYDMNGDGGLAREELHQCLKGCIIPGYGVEADELEDAEKDIVEICMKKLDHNRDGQITFDDFRTAVRIYPLLLVACGPCLPNPHAAATFLATISDDYRAYSGAFTGPEGTLPKSFSRRRITSFSSEFSAIK